MNAPHYQDSISVERHFAAYSRQQDILFGSACEFTAPDGRLYTAIFPKAAISGIFVVSTNNQPTDLARHRTMGDTDVITLHSSVFSYCPKH